jgi:5-methyltetrahydrofolate--homocysteine methyltransferase
MVTVAEEMQRAQMTMPLLIGGATTSRVHTALRIDPAYTGPVVHVLDASRAVGVATALVSDTQRDPYVTKVADEYEHVRVARAGKGQSALLPLEDARANGFEADMTLKPGKPRMPGVHHFDDWDLKELRDYIDWTPFFRAWELAGNYPAILTDEVVGESATSLFADAQKMLDKLIAERWLTARGVAGLWPCRREDDDVIVHLEGERHVRLPFLRQQIAKREGRANMCLADFIDHDGDRIWPSSRRRSTIIRTFCSRRWPIVSPRRSPSGCTSSSAPRCGAMPRASSSTTRRWCASNIAASVRHRAIPPAPSTA